MQRSITLDHLATALNGYVVARAATLGVTDLDARFAAENRCIRASNILLDTCLDAGMSLDVADAAEWAAVRVAEMMGAGDVA